MKRQLDYKDLINLLTNKNILLVTEKFMLEDKLVKEIKKENTIVFSEYSSNPKYEEVLDGLQLFKNNNCDCIVAIGGGSSIDVAKCIKAFSNMTSDLYITEEIKENNVDLVAIPTTAGTGSEETHFAVVYYNNLKYSMDSDYILPNYIYLNKDYLKTLPLYQKKSTMLDALCQAIESMWSVNATDKSREYASIAIELILNNYENYIKENEKSYEDMMLASNYSGKAINISKTTAAHAMSYKITSLYNIPHGHAVAMCIIYIWEYMINNSNEQLDLIFDKLDILFNSTSHIETLNKFKHIYESLNISKNINYTEDEIDILINSVNADRLNNNPVKLNKETIKELYEKILIQNEMKKCR